MHVVNSESDFRNLFKELLPYYYRKGGIWRGHQESCYKLYNTFQRENLQIDNPVLNVLEYIRRLELKFDEWDSKKIVPRFFHNFGIEYVPLFAKLSILRHYEAPSPLLDWTRNPNVAMYFSSQSNTSVVIKSELKDYFSIYFLDKEHPFYKYNSKTGIEFFESFSFNNLYNRLRLFGTLFPSKKKINYIFNTNNFLYTLMGQSPILRISDEDDEIVNHLTLTNLNITAQNGLFLLNTHSKLPLEEAILQRVKTFAPNKESFQEAYKLHKNNFLCFDVHKKFILEIRDNLNSQQVNVTKNNILFDFNSLKKDLSFDKIISD